jgi:hypothetical protein
MPITAAAAARTTHRQARTINPSGTEQLPPRPTSAPAVDRGPPYAPPCSRLPPRQQTWSGPTRPLTAAASSARALPCFNAYAACGTGARRGARSAPRHASSSTSTATGSRRSRGACEFNRRYKLAPRLPCPGAAPRRCEPGGSRAPTHCPSPQAHGGLLQELLLEQPGQHVAPGNAPLRQLRPRR